MTTEKDRLEKYFSIKLQRTVTLTITDNVRSMVSFRNDTNGGLVLRLHNMFVNAPYSVLEHIIAWVNTPSLGSNKLKPFIRQNSEKIKKPRLKKFNPVRLEHKGRYFNLQSLFAELNAKYFDSRLEMRITWGKKIKIKRTKTVMLGSYHHGTKLITISRKLDRFRIPAYFIKYVIYHEMIHAYLGARKNKNGRRIIHCAEFKKIEREFHDYDKAINFENRFFG